MGVWLTSRACPCQPSAGPFWWSFSNGWRIWHRSPSLLEVQRILFAARCCSCQWHENTFIPSVNECHPNGKFRCCQVLATLFISAVYLLDEKGSWWKVTNFISRCFIILVVQRTKEYQSDSVNISLHHIWQRWWNSYCAPWFSVLVTNSPGEDEFVFWIGLPCRCWAGCNVFLGGGWGWMCKQHHVWQAQIRAGGTNAHGDIIGPVMKVNGFASSVDLQGKKSCFQHPCCFRSCWNLLYYH